MRCNTVSLSGESKALKDFQSAVTFRTYITANVTVKCRGYIFGPHDGRTLAGHTVWIGMK